MAAAQQAKSTAEGDLASTVKALADAETSLALAQAKKILQSTTSGAVEQSYSLLQVRAVGASAVRTRADLVNLEVINLVKRLAKQYHSSALAQLSTKISAVIRFGAAA